MSAPTQLSPRVAALLEKMGAARGRLIFALDATASREPTWDLAASLQAAMFQEAAKIGGLEVQLVYYRGDEVQQSPWLADAGELVGRMRAIRCMSGATQIVRMLEHIRAESKREKVSAAVFIGDAVEEAPGGLYDAAVDLGVPLFLFQEGDALAIHFAPRSGGIVYGHPPLKVEQVFREIARLTGGAYGKFDAGAARQLGELLQAATAEQRLAELKALLEEMRAQRDSWQRMAEAKLLPAPIAQVIRRAHDH